MTTTATERGDHVAAAIHWRRAEQHYAAADRFRRSGRALSERVALAAARQEERLAELLAYPDRKERDGHHQAA